MSENVYPLIPKALTAALEDFRASHELSDFLVALSHFSFISVEYPDFWRCWHDLKSDVNSDAALNEVLEWCTDHFVSSPDIMEIFGVPKIPSKNPHQNKSKFSKNTQELITKLVSETVDESMAYERYFKARSEAEDNPYWRIEAAWDLEPGLKQTFGDDDPAKHMATFIKTLFSSFKQDESQNQTTNIEIRNKDVANFLCHELLQWAIEHERTINEDLAENANIDQSTEAICRLRQIVIIEKQLKKMLRILLKMRTGWESQKGTVSILAYLPQRTFVRTCEFLEATFLSSTHSSLTLHEYLKKHAFDRYIDLLTTLPLGEPFTGYDEEMGEKIPEVGELRDVEFNIYPLTKIPYLPLSMIDGLLYTLSDAGQVFPNESDIEQPFGHMTKQVLRHRLKILLEQLINFSRNKPELFSQFSTYALERILLWVNEIESYWLYDTLPYPTHCLLAITSEGDSICSLFQGGYSFSNSKSFGDGIELCEAANAEGWYEFANNCLAFFIFSQGTYLPPRFADWSKLSPLLNKYSAYPGFDKVRIAARYAVDRLQTERAPSLDALCLKGWAASKPSLVGNVENIAPFINVTRKEIEAQLILDLGPNNWKNIQDGTIISLVDAERYWSAVHMQFGRGIKDYGAIANNYRKAVEGELKFHFFSILQSPEYDKWHLAEKGRPANKLYFESGATFILLKKFHKLPNDLRLKIEESGTKLHTNRDILEQWLQITKLLNKGSHANDEPFTLAELGDLREKLFSNGAIKSLLDCLL